VNVGPTFALVKSLTSRGILEALRKRCVYASTGQEVLIDFRVNDHIMGEEVILSKKPYEVKPRRIHMEVRSLVVIKKVSIIRNNVEVYSKEVNSKSVSFD